MAFTKGMKKGLSVLLSLAMVVTSVTVGGKTKEAEAAVAADYTISFDEDAEDAFSGTIQAGTVNITGTVEKGKGAAAQNVYGKIKLESTVDGFKSTTVFVEDGIFDATVDIAGVRDMVVPVKATLIDDASVHAEDQANPTATTKINVSSNKGLLVKFNFQDGDYTDYTMGKIVDLTTVSDGGMVIKFAQDNFFKESTTKIGNCYVELANAADADEKITTTAARELVSDVKALINDEDVTGDGVVNADVLNDAWKNGDGTNVWIEGLADETDPNEEALLSKVRITVNNPWSAVNKAVFKSNTYTAADIGAATGSSFGISLKIKKDADADAIDNAAAATTPEDKTSAAYPDTYPTRAPKETEAPASQPPASQPPASQPPASQPPVVTSGSSVATVTAVGMAPQAMTATTGAVATTIAAVLTVTGSSLDLLKVNNTVAANNVTVSAVSTSGIKVELKAPANVTSQSAAATFAAVVTVPANCATGNYGLTASVGAVKANVATVSVIAAPEATPTPDVHTTKIKVKTANGTNKTALMGVGEKATLKVVKTPKDSVDEVTAVSAKAKIVKASINKKGSLVLKAKKAGTAKVTVSSGEVSKKITVTVKKAPKKLTLKDGKKAAKKTVGLSANAKKKAVKKTYKITLPKNTASYDYTVKTTGKVVKSAVVKTSKKNVQTLVVTVKKKAKGRGKVIITSNANKKAKAQVNVIAK